MNRGATGLYDDVPRFFVENQVEIPCPEPDMKNVQDLQTKLLAEVSEE
jgi:hypothetical protein